MRTFAQKPEAKHDIKSARSEPLGQTPSGHDGERHSIFQSSRTADAERARRSLWCETDDEASSTGHAATRFAHDFSEKPVYGGGHVRLQPKLKVNAPEGKDEREADRVADRVMQTSGARPERACACGGGCPKYLGGRPGRTDRTVHTRPVQMDEAETTPAPPIVDEVLRSPGEPLDAPARAFFEPRFGYSFQHVRVHDNAQARRSANTLNAEAYTVGRHIVFGDGPAVVDRQRRLRLLAHELAHVVQQGAHAGDVRPAADAVRGGPRAGEGAAAGGRERYGGKVVPGLPGGRSGASNPRAPTEAASPVANRTASAPRVQRVFADTLDYTHIAARIHRAISGLGTDEEAVYQALQQLQRNREAIRRLERIYLENYHETLIEAIHGDFSGEELEFALQLLDHGERDPRAEERIETGPATTGDWDRAARRLYEAMPGTVGTEEEVVFAVLVPLNKDPARVERLSRAYRKLDPVGLKARLEDELSGEELDYAMSLLTPNRSHEYFLRRGHEELAGRPEFGHPAGEFCNIDAPDKEELYDRRYWEEHSDPERRSCKLRLKSGLRPSFAIESMFEDAGEWKLDCAQFVQILHLYAMLHTLGPFEFDRRFGGGAFELRMAESSWIDTETLWFRDGPNQLMQPGTREGEKFEPSADLKPRTVDRVLADAPVGSRVMWHNALLEGSLDPGERAFIEENALKLGDDAYSAHPLSSSAMTRRAIEERMGGVRIPEGLELDDVIRRYVYIREIEFYRRP